MSELPQGWTWSALQAACTVVRGITFPATAKEPESTDTNVCCLRTSNIQRQIEWKDVYYVSRSYVKREDQFVQQGDVLMSMANSYELVGKVAKVLHVPSPTAFGAFLSAVRPTPAVNGDYLFHFLRTERVQNELREGSSQTTNIANISVGRLESIAIPLAPSAEQTRIANQLDTLLTRIQSCNDRFDAIPALLKRFRQTVLDAATTGVLTEEWRETHCLEEATALNELIKLERSKRGALKVRGNSANVETELLFELPPSWAWVANHRLAHDDGNAICAGPFGTIFKAKDFRSSGVPIIFLRHVGNSRFLTHKPGFMDEQIWAEFHQPYSVFGGELLITKLGDPPGTACIYPLGNGKAMVTPDVMKMSVNAEAAETKYLMYFFNSPNAKKIVEALCFGVTRLRIDLSMFKTFPIPLPPRKEQTEIVRRVEALFALADRIEARATAAHAHAQRLSPLVLAKAFRGELVPQDPQDEPASVLLTRIAAERSTSAPLKASRSRKPKGTLRA